MKLKLIPITPKTLKYKNTTFKKGSEFLEWLKSKTKYIVRFNSDGFDPTRWFLDSDGEVLYSLLQGAIWQSKIISIPNLLEKNVIVFINEDDFNSESPYLLRQKPSKIITKVTKRHFSYFDGYFTEKEKTND